MKGQTQPGLVVGVIFRLRQTEISSPKRYFPSGSDGVTYIECDLGYRFPTRTLNPNPNPNRKSNNSLYSAKRHSNKVQDNVINISYFVGQGLGV